MDLMESWDPLDHPPRIEIRRADSDDSDAEGGLGNVTHVVLRPPGHSGKAKRGHLSFDASYETGNLGRVDFVSEFEYDLFIRPDTCNPRYRMWFNFVVDNVRQDQRVIFNLVNLSKTKTLFSNGMTPLVKTTSRPKWQRLGPKYVYYHKSIEHRNHYILSFAFVFDREEDVYQFAISFTYSYSRLEIYLTYLLQKNLPFITLDTLTHSLQVRKVEMVTISNQATIGVGKRPKVVFIIGRSNPGESPTSYISQGLIDFLISSHPLAGVLRDHVVVKIVPMLNPDGVFIGNYRTSMMGHDFNRNWNQISPWSHPELNALKNYLLELNMSKTMELDMIFDLHAHTSLLGAFIYGNSYEDVYRFERHILFPKLLAHNAEDYNPIYTMYNRDPSKGGCARRHLCDHLRSSVNVYTLEVSFYGYVQHGNGSSRTIPYTEDGYSRLGRNMVRTFADYYRATGIIPVKAFLSTVSTNQEINDDEKKKKLVRRSRSRSHPREIEKAKDSSVLNLEPSQRESRAELGNTDSGEDGDVDDDEDDENILDPNFSPAIQQVDPLNLPIDLQKSSVDSNPQIKFAYQTFDFSSLHRNHGRKTFGSQIGFSGRKIGGGGIIGKQMTKKCQCMKPQIGQNSLTLKIIDFNDMIRNGFKSNPLDSIEFKTDIMDTGVKHRSWAFKLRSKRSHKQHRKAKLPGYVTDYFVGDESTGGSDSDDNFQVKGLHYSPHHMSAPFLNSLPSEKKT